MDEEAPIALITGASRGLGLETAKQLAERGMRVVLSARGPGAAAEAATTLADLGDVTALEVGLDVASMESVEGARHAFERRSDRLDVLINNAAAYVAWDESATSADLDRAAESMNTNLFGPWRMTVAFLPLLGRSAHPRIVNVSSGAGSHGDEDFGLHVGGGAAPAYGISKAAQNALTSMLAAALADTPVIANAVCPGLTATWPGAESMGARPVADGAAGIVWAAMLPDDGPRGGLFRDGVPLPW